MPSVQPDFESLRRHSRAVARNAHVPYSGSRVGAAAQSESGEIFMGVNVENASFGLTLCAEAVLLGTRQVNAGGQLLAITACLEDGTVLAPCGRCRQMLVELAPAVLVDIGSSWVKVAELLPHHYLGTELVRSDEA